jgi:MoaA/NifB/PqqE/SkfB family radical SAM enzyme
MDVTEGDMSDEVFEASLTEIDPGTMICAALHGEPMLHPKFPELLSRWKSKGLRVGLPLSGYTSRFIPEMLSKESPVYSVLVSVDGVCDDTQASHRGNISLAKVEAFVRSCLVHRANGAFIGVRMVQNGQSELEFELFLRHWLLEVGVDVVLRAKWSDYAHGSPALGERCHCIRDRVPTITWDGDVLLCERVPDRKLYVLGNVLKEPLSVIMERSRERGCCTNCSLAIVDCGMKGTLGFRHGPDIPIYFHSDHYQQFYSLTKSWEGITWK